MIYLLISILRHRLQTKYAFSKFASPDKKYQLFRQVSSNIHYYRKVISAGSKPPSTTIMAAVGESQW